MWQQSAPELTKFILSDVRCFEGKHEFELRPLTFLVGENSTGKSTVLGCMQALANYFHGNSHGISPSVDFNQTPYVMGAFTDIARKSMNRENEPACFRMGLDCRYSEGQIAHWLFEFREQMQGSEPVINSIHMEFEGGEIAWNFRNNIDQNSSTGYVLLPIITDTEGKKRFTFEVEDDLHFQHVINLMNRDFRHLSFGNVSSETDRERLKILLSLLKEHIFSPPQRGPIGGNDIFPPCQPFLPPVWKFNFHSFAPVRSKPKRTYDPVSQTPDPEGNEVATILANLCRQNNEQWNKLKCQLEKFGEGSGLFDAIEIRLLGESTSDPFQIRLKHRNGPPITLIDVGYGVSQILPILVPIMREKTESRFLLQQPELHLHPRGQAQLASFLISMHKAFHFGFVVETHSDYIIDRTRIEIMKGNINPEKVSLIYFQPVSDGNKVKVHNIDFDDQANLIGAPTSFRDFFTRESDQLLGIQD